MLKNKVMVFFLLALAALLLQIVLSLGKPAGQAKVVAPLPLIFSAIILQRVKGAAAAEI